MLASTTIDTTALALVAHTSETAATIEPGSYDHLTVVIPYVAGVPTQWHPRSPVGPFATLTRGAFRSAAQAREWAEVKLEGHPYDLEFVEADRWQCDSIKADELAAYSWNTPEYVAEWEQLDSEARARAAA